MTLVNVWYNLLRSCYDGSIDWYLDPIPINGLKLEIGTRIANDITPHTFYIVYGITYTQPDYTLVTGTITGFFDCDPVLPSLTPSQTSTPTPTPTTTLSPTNAS